MLPVKTVSVSLAVRLVEGVVVAVVVGVGVVSSCVVHHHCSQEMLTCLFDLCFLNFFQLTRNIFVEASI